MDNLLQKIIRLSRFDVKARIVFKVDVLLLVGFPYFLKILSKQMVLYENINVNPRRASVNENIRYFRKINFCAAKIQVVPFVAGPCRHFQNKNRRRRGLQPAFPAIRPLAR